MRKVKRLLSPLSRDVKEDERLFLFFFLLFVTREERKRSRTSCLDVPATQFFFLLSFAITVDV